MSSRLHWSATSSSRRKSQHHRECPNGDSALNVIKLSDNELHTDNTTLHQNDSNTRSEVLTSVVSEDAHLRETLTVPPHNVKHTIYLCTPV